MLWGKWNYLNEVAIRLATSIREKPPLNGIVPLLEKNLRLQKIFLVGVPLG
jgi:hypothetical protein